MLIATALPDQPPSYRVEVLVSPTDDMGKLLGSMHGIPTQGTSNFCNAMQVAQVCAFLPRALSLSKKLSGTFCSLP